MKAHLSLAVLWLFILAAAPVLADDADNKKDAAAEEAKSDDRPLVEQVKENPNDARLLNKFYTERFQEIVGLAWGDKADEADEKLDELEQISNALQPSDDDAKALLGRAKSAIGNFREQVAIFKTSLKTYQKQLLESPSDGELLSKYLLKVQLTIGPIIRSDPEKAEKELAGAKEFLTKLEEKADNEDDRQRIARTLPTLARLEPSIEAGKKLLALVGKDMMPIDVTDWVGPSYAPEDLKGKVVLLDFWAVWCGPCIATFPHLIEWHEKYADKGLVIIGLTRYYDYKWDEDNKRAVADPSGVDPQVERKMLAKFKKDHGLKHTFALQEDDTLSDYYGVSGIPHVVLIDQQGKIRLIRVGSGAQNAKDIDEMIQTLLDG
jgi:thiol-disulfide isomerase/thioredoxin